MKVGIVGHAQDKFTKDTEAKARTIIREILTSDTVWSGGTERPILVSGRSPMGGVDIYAEEIADEIGIPKDIKTPKTHSWDGEYGFKARNLDIAKCSDVIHVVLVKDYPKDYRGRRFDTCYHCVKIGNDPKGHVKSGGCWTAIEALKLDKKAVWHIITS